VKYLPSKRVKYCWRIRCGSPYTPRIWPGHESSRHRLPLPAPSIARPSSSTSPGRMPKNGHAADPGFSGVAPGSGLIRIPPVSVCHQVSTTGQRPSPTTLWYHSHASGLIGSPTEPSRRSDLREAVFTGASPSRMSARIAVGAV
jgi:hypothetical protein